MGILRPNSLFLSVLLLLGLDKAAATTPPDLGLTKINFHAKYKARYQHALDSDCTGPPPTIQVFCRQELSPNSISDASISCRPVRDAAGWQGLECSHTCVGACDNSMYTGENFGEIVFTCLGETEDAVDAYMNYVGGPPGSCSGTGGGSGTAASPRNSHVAQLGVQCDGVYDFDDAHFECSVGSVSSKVDDKYTCSSGQQLQACGQGPCQVDYQDVIVNADRQYFHECIQALWPSLPVGPEPDPPLADSAPGFYTVTFQAEWQLSLDANQCSGQLAPKQIHCLNGTTLSPNIQPLHDTVDCQPINASAMTCRDTTAQHVLNGYSGVQYECQGSDMLPTTQVVYESAPSYCNMSTATMEATQEVAHSLRLGVLCGNDTIIAHDDQYFECGPENDYEFEGGIYTCQSVQTFTRQQQQSSNSHETLEPVVMQTDYRWSFAQPDECYDYVPILGDGDTEVTVVESTDPGANTGGGGLGIPVATAPPGTDPGANTGGGSGGLGIPVAPAPPPVADLGIPISTPVERDTGSDASTGGGLGIPIATAAPMTDPGANTGGGGLGIPIAETPTAPTEAPLNILDIPVVAPMDGGGMPTTPMDMDNGGLGIAIPVATPDEEEPDMMMTTDIPATMDPTTTEEVIMMEEVSMAPFTNPPGTIYRASYVGRFQQVRSEGCENSPPSMVLTCTGNIVSVSASDPSIRCNLEVYELVGGRQAILCENTCQGDACESVYLSREAVEEPYGEVYFECQGESLDDIDGSFIVVEAPQGYCIGTDPAGLGYNLNIIQLGVLCPTATDGSGNSGSLYVVDDSYSECGLRNQALGIGQAYSCVAGLACGADQCQVPFDQQLIVMADPHRFSHCVTTDNGSPVPEIPEPDTKERDEGTYTAQFKAVWFFQLQAACEGSESPKHITCTNGIIRLVEANVEGSPCEVISDNTIECRDSGLTGDVVYECEAYSEIPETTVEYVSGTASCDAASAQLVERALRLGIDCGGEAAEIYVYSDAFLECDAGNTFEVLGSNFTCFGSVSIPTSDNGDHRIPDVGIATDFRWPEFASNNCFVFQPATTRQRGLTHAKKDVGITKPDLAAISKHGLDHDEKLLRGRLTR